MSATLSLAREKDQGRPDKKRYGESWGATRRRQNPGTRRVVLTVPCAEECTFSPLVFVSLALLFFLIPALSDSLVSDTALARLHEAVVQYAHPFDPNLDLDEMEVAWTDLNDDGQQDALVYLHGTAWCGSGGCTVLVLAAVDSVDVEELGAYTPLAEISLMHGPVTVAPAMTNGWHDLVVEGEPRTWRRLSFDGETYPFSPSEGVPLAAPVANGTVLFAGS